MFCLQETKKEIVDRIMCQAIWGDKDISWAMQPANNSTGGILCIWNVHTFKLERKHTETGFIDLEGTPVAEGVKVNIVNVYSPCDVICGSKSSKSETRIWEDYGAYWVISTT